MWYCLAVPYFFSVSWIEILHTSYIVYIFLYRNRNVQPCRVSFSPKSIHNSPYFSEYRLIYSTWLSFRSLDSATTLDSQLDAACCLSREIQSSLMCVSDVNPYFVLLFLEFMDAVWIVVPGVIGWTLFWLSSITRSSAKPWPSSSWDSPKLEEANSLSRGWGSDRSETSKSRSAGNMSIAEQILLKWSGT